MCIRDSDCSLRDDFRTGNTKQWDIKNAGSANQPLYALTGKVLCTYVLSFHGNGSFSSRIRDCGVDCNKLNGYYRNASGALSSKMVRGAVPYHAALCGDHVGDYGSV